MALLVQFPLTIRAKRNGLINEPGRQFYLLYTHLMVNSSSHKTKYVYKKSTTVYVPSLELVLSQPLSRQRVCPSPQNRGGGAHSPEGEGLGESQFRRLEKKLSTLPTLCPTIYNLHTVRAQLPKVLRLIKEESVSCLMPQKEHCCCNNTCIWEFFKGTF
jgi:hypothetical protein